MNAKGKVFKYGADIDTDVIIPARYLNTSVPAELAKHCMEDSKQDINAGLAPFSQRVTPGAIMVADKNFGWFFKRACSYRN
jgi:3-isopropylmalate dehydratase small subunit